MSVRLFSSSISGIDAQLIEVEVDSTPGIHAFSIVGLPDKAVQESKDRIASAIKNSGLKAANSKHKKIIVNLAPADIKKEGPSYDLPIAIGYLLETGQIKFDPAKKMFVGELSLDGSLKNTGGILATAILAKNLGFKELIVPFSNVNEASVVHGLSIIGLKNVKEVIDHLTGVRRFSPAVYSIVKSPENTPDEISSLFSIKGQETAKRALIISAAGAHNALMSGPPGSGKTLLARSLTELLPKMSVEEAIEVAKVYSSAGLINGASLSFRRPFRSPHHTTSAPAMVGGGTWPKPGEISLAHRGVLFLDELPEFPRSVLESLRQPLEEGTITVSRTANSVTLPAKFTLIAAMNPCPCGNYGDERNACICAPQSVLAYRKKISGPLLDRIDIQINVPRETIDSPDGQENQEKPPITDKIKEIKAKIDGAREIQLKRYKNTKLFNNSEINYKNIDKYCVLDKSAEKLLKQAINAKGLSLRAYHKIKKLARTVADLEQSEQIREHHVAEAISLRINEKMNELG